MGAKVAFWIVFLAIFFVITLVFHPFNGENPPDQDVGPVVCHTDTYTGNTVVCNVKDVK